MPSYTWPEKHTTQRTGVKRMFTLMLINTGLTQKIFDYFLQLEARTFVFFSSVKAAADSVPGDLLTEDVVPAPVGPYGESKIRAEEYIIRARNQEPRRNIYSASLYDSRTGEQGQSEPALQRGE